LSLLFLYFLPTTNESIAQNTVRANNPFNADLGEYIEKIELPAGFKIELFAENVEGARSMSLSPSGILYVGTFRARGSVPGKIYAIVDKNKDNKADEVLTIASELFLPNGVAFKDGDLYIAEVNRILKLENIESRLNNPPDPSVVNDQYPDKTWHGWKFIRFGPDGKLYVPVGAPCNICEPDEDIFGTITRIDADGSGREIFARGIRNTVGFDWHPETKELWFTDNGRDAWGDDRPPEELNHAPEAGLHFGFPYRYGKALVDTTFKTTMQGKDFQPAAFEMAAHNAALGMRFYTGAMFPAAYRNKIFIAQHGSWNRSKPDGYRVIVVTLANNKAVKFEHFATGWLLDDKYWGRPVDIEILPDGSLLVSDDFASCIYRISYDG
ncbi:MAG: PQQ-dependent sugar dehydrogenase, partial [bacterium]